MQGDARGERGSSNLPRSLEAACLTRVLVRPNEESIIRGELKGNIMFRTKEGQRYKQEAFTGHCYDNPLPAPVGAQSDIF